MSTEDACPACGKPAARSRDNPFRPFCSERCKMSDLGDWFAERFTIPDEADPPPDSGSQQ